MTALKLAEDELTKWSCRLDNAEFAFYDWNSKFPFDNNSQMFKLLNREMQQARQRFTDALRLMLSLTEGMGLTANEGMLLLI
jgi:hypothetical protein